MKPLALFTNRSWPGVSAWLTSVLAGVAVFELLAIFAWKNEQGRLWDITTAAVAIPAGAVLLLMIAALLWALFGKMSFSGALGWSARLIPFAWAIPIFDIIRTYGNGLVIGPPKLNGVQLLLSMATGSVLPITSGFSIGVRLGIFTASVGVALVTWHFSKKLWKAVVSGFVWSAVAVKLLASVSLLSLWKDLFGSGWTVLPVEIMRRATLVMSQGYWWKNTYERFPTAVDAQVDIAARLVSAGFALCGLGFVLLIAFLLFQPKRWSLLRHVYQSWGAFDHALYVLAGVAIAIASKVTVHAASAPAFLLFFLVVAALRFASVMRRDIARLEQDERGNVSQPITRGELTAADARQYAQASQWFALAAAWVLGWPVFASVGIYLAASHLTRDRLWSLNPWALTLFRALGAGALALSGLFVITQDARITTFALTAAVVVALHRLFIELFWIPRMRMGK